MTRRSKDTLEYWFDYHVDTVTRTIMIAPKSDSDESEDVDGDTATYAIQGLHLLEHGYRKDDPVTILMSSGGGHVSDGFAIYDKIRSMKCEVMIEVMGQASSMGSVIMQAGDLRRIHPNAFMLLHDGDLDLGRLKPKDHRAHIDFEERVILPKMYQIYAERSTQTAEWFSEQCKHDFLITAQEAYQLGLADEVL